MAIKVTRTGRMKLDRKDEEIVDNFKAFLWRVAQHPFSNFEIVKLAADMLADTEALIDTMDEPRYSRRSVDIRGDEKNED